TFDGATAHPGDPVVICERELVADLEQAIARRIGLPRYKLWFVGHTRFRWQDDQLLVGVPNRHFEEWLQKTFGTAVAAAAQEIFDRPMQVRFTIDPELFQAARREMAEAQQTPISVRPDSAPEQPESLAPPSGPTSSKSPQPRGAQADPCKASDVKTK